MQSWSVTAWKLECMPIGSKAMLQIGYHLLRATPWRMMRIVRQLNARRMHSPHTERHEIARFHELMRETTRQGYLSRLKILQSYDVRGHLPTLGAPVLFLAADRDTLVPAVQQARMMSALTPGGRLPWIPEPLWTVLVDGRPRAWGAPRRWEDAWGVRLVHVFPPLSSLSEPAAGRRP